MDNARLIQITDFHLFNSPHGTLLNLNTRDSFLSVYDALKAHEQQIDGLILTGDLAQDEQLPTYHWIAEQLHAISDQTHYLAGNHDASAYMQQAFSPQGWQWAGHFELAGWLIILMDSQRPGAVPGYLTCAELTRLQRLLSQYPHRPTLIAMHHHVLELEAEWLSPLGVVNKDAFWALIKPFSQVKLVATGHIHQELDREFQNVRVLSTPSTCFQFKPVTVDFALDPIPPGYRWFDLQADGQYKTGVVRTLDFTGSVDLSSVGYE